MLKAENLNVYYGQIHALHDISFEVKEGEIVALIGANGAGKTTTLKTLSGMLRSKTGSVTFCGENISHAETHTLITKGLAHVPEGRRVFLQMSVQENLEMGAYTCPSYIKEGLAEVYGRFPRLLERKNQVAGTLSGGEQQMLAMGRALMGRPKLLMLDEPSMGLAPILVQQIFDIIAELHKAGTTIILVEQNAEMALHIADRAYVLESGRVALSGAGEELANSETVRLEMARMGADVFGLLLPVLRADFSGQNPGMQEEKFAYADRLEKEYNKAISENACVSLSQLSVTGSDIARLGFRGPAIGETLKTLLRLVIKNEVENEKSALLSKAETLLP